MDKQQIIEAIEQRMFLNLQIWLRLWKKNLV